MVELVDDGELSIIVQELREPEHRRLRFSFTRYPAYRNILEEYRLELWEKISGRHEELGHTILVPNSPWAKELRESEPLLDVHDGRLTHFMICTEDDVLEVLAPDPPEMTWIEPGSPSETAGKSKVLRDPDGREQIDELIRDVKQRSKNPPA
jgi:hypothetical protein